MGYLSLSARRSETAIGDRSQRPSSAKRANAVVDHRRDGEVRRVLKRLHHRMS